MSDLKLVRSKMEIRLMFSTEVWMLHIDYLSFFFHYFSSVSNRWTFFIKTKSKQLFIIQNLNFVISKLADETGQHIKVYLLFWRYDEKCVNIEFFQDFVSFASFSIFHFKFASQLEESRFCDMNTPEARKKELDRNSVKNNSPFSQANSFFSP